MKIFNGLHGFIWQSMTANNCNTFLIDGPARILIDPGHRQFFSHVEEGLGEIDLTPADIDVVLITHAHPDHMEAADVFANLPARLTMHEAEWRFLKEMESYIESAMGVDLAAYEPDFFLTEGDFSISGMDFSVFYTPGHTRGSLSLFWQEPKALFTGDLIFKDGVGRTDLPGGDPSALKESILKLAGLGAHWVLPGHGDIIAGAEAVADNFERLQQFWFGYL